MGQEQEFGGGGDGQESGSGESAPRPPSPPSDDHVDEGDNLHDCMIFSDDDNDEDEFENLRTKDKIFKTLSEIMVPQKVSQCCLI